MGRRGFCWLIYEWLAGSLIQLARRGIQRWISGLVALTKPSSAIKNISIRFIIGVEVLCSSRWNLVFDWGTRYYFWVHVVWLKGLSDTRSSIEHVFITTVHMGIFLANP